MCGDGTNDVGALKAAHVGVSIVNDPEFEKRIEEAKDLSIPSHGGGKKAKGTNAKERMARAMAEVQAQDIDPTIVKLGDASIASPFTARRTSVDCVLTVLRQGRCTLVTTIQVRSKAKTRKGVSYHSSILSPLHSIYLLHNP